MNEITSYAVKAFNSTLKIINEIYNTTSICNKNNAITTAHYNNENSLRYRPLISFRIRCNAITLIPYQNKQILQLF